MKKLLLSAALLAAGLFANDAKAQSNVFKVNIFSPIVSTASVFYERAISDDKSVQLGFFYTGFKVTDTKFSGFGITPELRFYLSESNAPEGFYVAPFARYQNFTLTNEFEDFSGGGGTTKSEATLSTIGGGVIAGKHWIFKERISLDAFLGPQLNSGSVEVKSGDESSFSTGAFSGFGIRTGLTFGVAF